MKQLSALISLTALAAAVALMVFHGPRPVRAQATPAPASGATPALTAPPNRTLPPVPPKANADAAIQEVLKVARERFPRIPALAAVVVRDGRIVGEGVAGVRKAKNATPVTMQDLFHLGTCTKAVTATLIGVLIDEGKLRWDSTILEVLGRDTPEIHPSLVSVTVDQLLHHRGGFLPRGPKEVWERAQRAKGSDVEQRIAYANDMLALEPAKTPGDYQYSNAGYVVLGRMAEVVTGTPFEDLMQQKVFKPLGITTAVFGQPGNPTLVDQPWPHSSGNPVFRDNPACLNPSARLCMSMEDWARFANFHLGHQPTPPLLKPATFEALHAVPENLKPDQMGYACGWFRPLRPWANGRALHHVGGNALTYCAIWLLPQEDMGVLVATNEGTPMAGDVTDLVAGSLLYNFRGIEPKPLDSARPREKDWPGSEDRERRRKQSEAAPAP
jgi:CubicO group peptidase (beta-lactamase class C family)